MAYEEHIIILALCWVFCMHRMGVECVEITGRVSTVL